MSATTRPRRQKSSEKRTRGVVNPTETGKGDTPPSQPPPTTTATAAATKTPTTATTASYESLVQKYGRSIPQRSLLKCCSESLAVVQEFTLSVFFIARYQMSMQWEEEEKKSLRRHLLVTTTRLQHRLQQQQREQQLDHLQARLDWAHGFVLIGFCIILAVRSQKHRRGTTTSTRIKARHRLTDACVLGFLLRLFASVLSRLTASYSSDTVQALTLACMGLHLLTCDYQYSSGGTAAATINTTVMDEKKRPPFRGGTVSLNASFFATVLCISRLESDFTSYFFCSLAVIFFGFYPQARAELMAEYPPHTRGR